WRKNLGALAAGGRRRCRSLVLQRGLDAAEKLAERGRIEEPAIRYDRGNPARVSNVAERVRVEEHQIGHFSFRYCSEGVGRGEIFSGVVSGSAQCFERREPRADQQLKLLVKAESRKHERL